MIGQKLLIDQATKWIDKTIGKKFKIVDQLTDLFQGVDAKVAKLEQENKEIKERLKQLEERI